MFNVLRKKHELLPPEFIEQANNAVFYTPDATALEKFEFQLIFIYDHMMLHRHYHHVISDHSTMVANAFTKDDFSVFQKNLGKETFPIPLQAFENIWTLQAPIRGQLHLMRSYHFLELDKIKENGVQFIRQRVRLKMPYRAKLWNGQRDYKFPDYEVTAWMYVGSYDHWSEQIDNGYLFSPVSRFYPKNDKGRSSYYYF